MLFDNFPLPMPWYGKIELQDRFRQNVAQDPRILQLSPKDGLLPFQFAKEITSELPVSWKIMCAGNNPVEYYMNGGIDEEIIDLTDYIGALIEATTLNGMDYFIFKDQSNSTDFIELSLPGGLLPGVYYMMMEFRESAREGSDRFYVSELFRVPDDRFSWVENSIDCKYPCLKWSNNSDIAPMHYNSGDDDPFYNKLYLDTFITATEPTIEVEVETDGLGEDIPIKTKSRIRYRLSSVVPDFVKVAMYTMLMHENKSISLEYGFRSGEIKAPEITQTLSSDGAFSFVELLFEQMIILVDSQCDDNMAEPDPYETPSGVESYSEYCEGTGVLFIKTIDMPAGLFGKIEYSMDSGATYIECWGYTSREELNEGVTIGVASGLGADFFRVAFYTFTFRAGESDPSAPVSSC